MNPIALESVKDAMTGSRCCHNVHIGVGPEVHCTRPAPRDRKSIDHGHARTIEAWSVTSLAVGCIVGLTVTWPRGQWSVSGHWRPRTTPGAISTPSARCIIYTKRPLVADDSPPPLS